MSIVTYQAIADAYEKYNFYNTAELYQLLRWLDI